MKQKIFLGLIQTIIVAVFIFIIWNSQPVSSCYGPHITAAVSPTQIDIYESVTVTGTICVGIEESNMTVRVTFVRPDYSWIDQLVVADEETGEFTATQALDMAGYWNIFPILGHINDRLGVTVTDPTSDPANPPPIVGSPFRPNFLLIGAAVTTVSIGAIVAVTGLRKKTRKIC